MLNKVVWITGASSGIGEELAYEFARQGATIVLTARGKEKLELVRDNCLRYTKQVHVFAADLSEVDSLKTLVDDVKAQVGNIDVLVNNAGMSQRSMAVETPLENDRKIMELNFFSAVGLTKLVLPSMLKQKSGHVVVVSSIVGKFGFPLRSAYSASKHALQGYFESLRAELSHEGIQVTIVLPGRIKTNVSRNALTKDGSAYGKMDPGQDKGMDAALCASKIVKGITKGKKEFLVGKNELLMVHIRRWLPGLYHRMVGRINSK